MARAAISEFGIVQKNLAGATVTFYQTDANGEKTTTKATVYQASTGDLTRANPQTLDADGKLSSDCYVAVPVMAEISNISVATERNIRKIRMNPIHYLLPMTSAAVQISNPVEVTVVGGTIDGTPIGATTPAAGTFTSLTCSSFVETSDERLKTNIKPLHEAASKLLAMNPVEYQRKTTASNPRTEIGFVAQEVEKILPDMVSKDGEYLSLHYLDIIALLVKGYQEMASHVVELNHRIKALEVE